MQMACPLTTALYRAPPRNPCLEANHVGCSSQTSDIDAAMSSRAHRCVEQTCFSYGSCLMQPCESLRPIPTLSDLDVIVKSCQDAQPNDTLLCSFLSLNDYLLYYDSYDTSTSVEDCWQGLRRSLALNPGLYDNMRVWEQIGYTKAELAGRALKSYQENYANVIQSSISGSM